MKDYHRGEQAGYLGSGRVPKNAAQAMGEAAGRNRREQERVMLQNARVKGEPIFSARVVYIGVVVLVVLPMILGLIWGAAMYWAPGFRAVVIAISVLAILLVPLVKRFIGAAIGIYLGLFVGLGVASIENMVNHRPVTLANLNFITFLFLVVGVVVTIVLALRHVGKTKEQDSPTS